jgi:hypothetical protein
MAQLGPSFPGKTAREIVAGPLAETAFGPLPLFSNLVTHHVVNVATAAVGAFVICHVYDPELGGTAVVLIRRTDRNAAGKHAFGVPGGFTNLDFTTGGLFIPASPQGEQPAQGAARELREEIVDDAGCPLLDLDPARMQLITSGIDYRAVATSGLPVQYNGHAVRLMDKEWRRLRRHVARMQTNPDYRKAVQEKSGNEVADVVLMGLKEAAALSPQQFAHPHELSALQILNTSLNTRRPKASAGRWPIAAPELQ